MKTYHHHLFIPVGILCMGICLMAVGRSEAEAADNDSPRFSVSCGLRLIEAPRDEINRLIAKTDYVLQSKTLRQLQDLIDQKTAVLLAEPRVATLPGCTANTKSVRELIYPTEYEPPQVVSAGGSQSAGASETTPAALKTRELGVLVNMTPVVSADGQWIYVALATEDSRLSKLGFVKQSAAGTATVAQPDIYSRNLNTSVVLKSGSTIVLAIVDPVSDEKNQAQENVVVMLLTATTTRTE